VAVIDLGGGSLELAVGEGTRCLLAGSLPLGALAVRERLGYTGAFDAVELGRVYELLRESGGDLFAQARALSPEVVVFASGTARRACEQLMPHIGAAGSVGELESAGLRHAVSQLTQRERVEGTDLRAMDATLIAGSIMLASLDLLNIDRAIMSNKGLRDGVALDAYRQFTRRAQTEPVRTWNRRLADLALRPASA
jgi:exopolyphosphatase/guanosine-5'-triphosphate,3'-diphosphate pyrophosphatase